MKSTILSSTMSNPQSPPPWRVRLSPPIDEAPRSSQTRHSARDVFSNVLLSDDIQELRSASRKSSHSGQSPRVRKSFAARANVIVPEAVDDPFYEDEEGSSSFNYDDFESDSWFDSSNELEISEQEFNAKPLSWRVSYVVMRQFQESSNLMRVSSDLEHLNASAKGEEGGANTLNQQMTAHVDLATHSNFYDIDFTQKKRLARASFFRSATKQMRFTNKKRYCQCMDRFVMTPEHRLRQIWDVVVLFLLMYTMLFLPVKVAFYKPSTSGTDVDPADLCVDILFFIDIVMSFLTAFKLPDGTVVRKFHDITAKYMRTWFILDVVATFPFYLIGSNTLDRIAPIIRIPRLLKMLRLVRLVKLVRAYRLKKFFEKIEYSPKIHQGFIRIIKLLLLVVCFAHFSACLWFFIGDLSEDSHGFSWISVSDTVRGSIIDEPIAVQYIASLYFSISTLSTLGIGDITPTNEHEMIFAVVLMLVGATTFSYITATISSVMHDFDVKASLYRSKMANLVGFVKTSNLSKKLSSKLMSNMSTIWSTEINTNEDTSKLRDELPRLMLYEVSLEMHANLINTSAFFSLFDNLAAGNSPRKEDSPHRKSREASIGLTLCASTPNSSFSAMDRSNTMTAGMFGHCIQDFAFIGELVSEMRPETAFDGEFIANVAEPVNFWAIVKSGSVVAISAIDSSMELMLWGDGDSLGEVGIFLTQQWPWNMRCTEDTAYFTVSTQDFLAIIAHHRSVSRKLVKLAGQRIERIVKIKRKLRNMQDNKLRRQMSRSNRQMGQDKAKLHYRLQNLITAKTDENHDIASSAAVAKAKRSDTVRHSRDNAGLEEYGNDIATMIQQQMANDPLRGTAKGRWKMLRMYVHATIAQTRSKREKFRNNFKEVTQLAMQVKRFQDALDEIQREMVIWKQGMTFQTRDKRRRRNFLQAQSSLIPEE